MNSSSRTCYCQDSELVRKQREEIILLTRELENQEEHLNIIQNNNDKLKSTVKAFGKEKTIFDNDVKRLNSEIKKLKGSHLILFNLTQKYGILN